jgi:NAD(P)H-hydrate epimerase
MSSPETVTLADLPRLPPRAADSHKGDYGRILIVGGSRGMSGAIAMAGMSALRSGAGLVRMAVPDRVLDVVAGFEPSLMTTPLPNDAAGRLNHDLRSALNEHLSWADVVALGPGLGRSEELTDVIGTLWHEIDKPMVVDADGLFALSEWQDALPGPGGRRVITPHAGEFTRLLGDEGKKLSKDQLPAAAVEWATKNDAVVVLKGPHTLVTDGGRQYINNTGNPGMATGGTGDILTGVIAALIGQKLEPFVAAAVGVHLHGLAGDLAAKDFGQVSMIASDLLKYLPHAFQSYLNSAS